MGGSSWGWSLSVATMSRRGFNWEGIADFDLWLRFVLLGAAAAAVLVGMGTEALAPIVHEMA